MSGRADSPTSVDPDSIHRLVKMLMDDGVASREEAESILAALRLQIHVGPNVVASESLQSGMLTAVNAAGRAFLGGVEVLLERDGAGRSPWASSTLAAAIERYGGRLVTELDPQLPTVVFGQPERAISGQPTVYAVARGWAGGVTDDPSLAAERSAPGPFGALLAAGLAVSEIFQHVRGYPVAGERTIGLSAWGPQLDWLADAATGPELRYLPKSLWLVGLGHLGQAYAWTVGCLPYADRTDVTTFLQDADALTEANLGTSLLAEPADRGKLKTRVTSAALERLGFKTRLLERRLDPDLKVTGDDPTLALIGVDRPTPRHYLSNHGWSQIVDAGLGATVRDYLGIDVRDLRPGDDSTAIWPAYAPQRDTSALESKAAYQRLREQSDVRCGVQRLAGVAVATAFVGVVAGALVVATPCRVLHQGPRHDRLISVHLRNLDAHQVVSADESARPSLAFQDVRTES